MKNALDFTDKRVLVVGGSSGIGNGIARAFLDSGAEVHVWGTRASAADYAGDDGSDLSGIQYAQMDVSDFDAIEAYAPPFDSLDVLVLSQGTVLYKRQEFKMPGWQKVMDVNIGSLMACSEKFHDMLAAAKGSLITISSTAGYHATRGNPAYSASKTGAIGLTKTLGEAWASDGIRVNGIAPGLVDTKLTKVTTENPKRLEGSLRNIPLHRLGTPEDMAGVALFLASPLSAYVVGQTIPVDGEVAEVGRGVTRFKAGDQVMLSAAVGCGSCGPCLSGHINQCANNQMGCYGLGHNLEGCQAEGIRVPMADFNLRAIPDGISADQALMLTDNLPTAYLGCLNADIGPGKTVAVVGLGPIGLMAVEIAFVLGASKVYALDLVPERRARAETLGAIALDPANAQERLMEETQGRMLDCAVEAVGSDITIRTAIDLVGAQGTVSVIGVNQSMDFQFPMGLAFIKGLTFRISACSVQCHWDELISLIRGDRLHPEMVITHRMGLSEGPEAYRLFDTKEDGALKMVLSA
eukprot:g4601.t1